MTAFLAGQKNVLCPWTKDSQRGLKLKSQDIFLLMKLLSLHAQHEDLEAGADASTSWQDWDADAAIPADVGPGVPDELFTAQWLEQQFSVRGLSASTGVSKSEVSAALKRCMAVGLAKPDRSTQWPTVNKQWLWEFVVYGIRFVFPAQTGELTRGIATGVGAPVLADKLMTAGDLVPVWPDPLGRTMGLAVEPLFKTVPQAVKRDPRLYALLALVDAIRLGRPREHHFAANALKQWMRLSP